MTASEIEGRGSGFVFATTGDLYTTLARRAARSLRAAMPEAAIDLFTDQKIDDPVFDRIHGLAHDGRRPKMEALRRSRFARTIYLDADIMVLADISEIFDLLDTFDLAAALGNSRAEPMMLPDGGVPRAFPVVNSGVIAARASPRLAAFLTAWEQEVIRTEARFDQTSLRRLLFGSDLRFIALPVEYNVKNIGLLDIWKMNHGAPRVLHQAELHQKPPGDPDRPFGLEDLLSKARADHVRALIATDWSLGGTPGAILTPAARLSRRFRKVKKRGAAGRRRSGGLFRRLHERLWGRSG